jgi:hypothetical protein
MKKVEVAIKKKMVMMAFFRMGSACPGDFPKNVA